MKGNIKLFLKDNSFILICFFVLKNMENLVKKRRKAIWEDYNQELDEIPKIRRLEKVPSDEDDTKQESTTYEINPTSIIVMLFR